MVISVITELLPYVKWLNVFDVTETSLRSRGESLFSIAISSRSVVRSIVFSHFHQSNDSNVVQGTHREKGARAVSLHPVREQPTAEINREGFTKPLDARKVNGRHHVHAG